MLTMDSKFTTSRNDYIPESENFLMGCILHGIRSQKAVFSGNLKCHKTLFS